MQRRNPSFIAFVALCLLFIGQCAAVMHASEHLEQTHVESCGSCVQAESVDDLVVSFATVALIAPAGFDVQGVRLPPFADRAVCASARAPPIKL